MKKRKATPTRPRCPHRGEVEVRVVGVTDDIYTFRPGTDGPVELDNDMSEDGERCIRVRCLTCGRTRDVQRWWAKTRSAIPAWIVAAVTEWEERMHEAIDRRPRREPEEFKGREADHG